MEADSQQYTQIVLLESELQQLRATNARMEAALKKIAAILDRLDIIDGASLWMLGQRVLKAVQEGLGHEIE